MKSVISSIRRVFGRGSAPGGVVLLYHRVTVLEHDPHFLAVAPGRFADHLDVISTRGVPMALTELVAHASAGSLPAGAVAVTFDDGYADNLLEAAPLLERAGVPATIFLTTAAIADRREFWWDELERFMLAGAIDRAGHDDACIRLRASSAEARDRVLQDLAARAGGRRPPRPTHRPLCPDEIRALASRPGITLGSHTRSHPALARLSHDEQRREIAEARDTITALSGAPVSLLAYPFGGRGDVSPQTIDAARQEGMVIGCTTLGGTVTERTDAMEVPRAVVRDWTRAEFERRFLAWTGVAA